MNIIEGKIIGTVQDGHEFYARFVPEKQPDTELRLPISSNDFTELPFKIVKLGVEIIV